MSFSPLGRPMNWLCITAVAAAFWIVFRIVGAPAPAATQGAVEPTALVESNAPVQDVQDPGLERMIARMARATRR